MKSADRLKKSQIVGDEKQRLTKKAEKLMHVGLKAAKLHMTFLKESAQAQGMGMSSSQSSAESDTD